MPKFPPANIDVVRVKNSLYMIPKDEQSDDILELFANATIIKRRDDTEITCGYNLVLELRRE